MPLVSIIIPAFNICRYIRQCSESVISQTYDQLEIIVVDDGSTDDTGLILDQYGQKDCRFHVIHTENYGLSAARNTAIEQIHGEYIAFLDGDDWLESNAIEVLINYALANDADIVACRIYREWINATENSQMPSYYAIYNSDEACRELICMNHIGQGVWNKLYRRRLFATIKFPEGRVYEDISTTYRLISLASKVVWIPDMLVHYRMRVGSISHSFNPKNEKDRWTAHFNMYNDLCDKKQYRNILIKNCMDEIRRIWFLYGSFIHSVDASEQIIIEELFNELHSFACSHKREILNGNYSTSTKLVCVLALYRRPYYLKALGKANAIRESIKKNKHKMEIKQLYE